MSLMEMGSAGFQLRAEKKVFAEACTHRCSRCSIYGFESDPVMTTLHVLFEYKCLFLGSQDRKLAWLWKDNRSRNSVWTWCCLMLSSESPFDPCL